ncbi:MAG TPA: cell envelope integrity EipB family protein [Stellaceae bacterium]|nr:cell envelope integrity EipB family protein [Stellaceae bacterium]
MSLRPGRLVALSVALFLAAGPAALAADIAPHRALYSLDLAQTKAASGVTAATGAMVYEWGETCDGWTVQQRFRLRLQYAEQDDVDVSSSLVTWESKDGLRYRFNERRVRNGELDEEIKGKAKLDGSGKGGSAEFTKPEAATLTLPPGTIFPTAHTLVLIARARAGDQLVSRKVFDGATVENAGQITAVIGPELKPGAQDQGVKLPKSPLLQRPSWRMRLAFFPANSNQEQPDYELGMRLLDNGVSQDMTLDYGDYVVHAKLDDIEALPRPKC